MTTSMLAIVGSFAVILSAILSGPFSTEPRPCSALEPWLSQTRLHIAASDDTFRQIQNSDFEYGYDLSVTEFLFHLAQVFHTLSNEQYALTAPPGFDGLNDDIAYVLDAYGDVIDGGNSASLILGFLAGAVAADSEDLLGADLSDETSYLVTNLVFSMFNLGVDGMPTLSEQFEAVIEQDSVCGGNPPV